MHALTKGFTGVDISNERKRNIKTRYKKNVCIYVCDFQISKEDQRSERGLLAAFLSMRDYI